MFKCLVGDCIYEFPDVHLEIQKLMMTTHNMEVHGVGLYTPLERGGVETGGEGHGQHKTK